VDTPIFDEVTKARKLSIQEGRNLEREEIIDWASKYKNKTIRIDDLVRILKEKK